MPGWPVRVFISMAGSCYHATPYCPLLKAGQLKAAERGQVVTRIVCVSMTEARETDGTRAGSVRRGFYAVATGARSLRHIHSTRIEISPTTPATSMSGPTAYKGLTRTTVWII
jgi:hypothetical protein